MGLPRGSELIIILIVVLIIFGPKNLPKLGQALGSTVKNLREGMQGDDEKSEKVEEIEGEAAEDPEDARIRELEAELAEAKKKKAEEQDAE